MPFCLRVVRSRFAAAACAALVLIVSFACERPSRHTTVPGNELAEVRGALGNTTPFGLSGLAYFRGYLYASSNVGLLGIRKDRVEVIHKWRSSDDVIEGPWLDVAHGYLWIQQAHDNSLATFDGTQWRPVPFPTPSKGPFSRGDLLRGFAGASSGHGFWLVGGGSVWRWRNGTADWMEEKGLSRPSDPTRGSASRGDSSIQVHFVSRLQSAPIRGFAPLDLRPLYIVAEALDDRDSAPFSVNWQDEAGWQSRPLPDMELQQVVTAGDGAYLRTKNGEVVAIKCSTSAALTVQTLKTPGRCDSLTATAKGSVIASFPGYGIYSLTADGFTLAAAWPKDADVTEKHWAYLAEHDGTIAYASTPYSRTEVVAAAPNGTPSSEAALWLFVNGIAQRVPLR